MKFHVVITNTSKNTVKTETYKNMMSAFAAKCRIEEFADFGNKDISVQVVQSS